ncbi:hypothetical protein IMZ48_37625, partial [Candidatus Bathyarchaeota archaeon]|nr:hypothetical protein [Candidatus Bathyarchaeota archaeon]
PKVLICEEAAEVMEAHLISALMPGVEHFIQIGDHRQLRPQILNYSLSLETPSGKAWQLDRSQFERRAVGEPGMRPAPVAQLNVQRRMRPEISALIGTVYPSLTDHKSVVNLPDVVGMRKNLYWLDHNHPEDSGDDGARARSHSNDWEVAMATALVRHLVRQGKYSSSDIALLTPYTGQLRKLRTALSEDFEIFLGERDQEVLAFEDDGDEGGAPASPTENHKPLQKKQLLQTLRLATVDNFQGEEAKVILVSLVRSNQKRKVGFLRTENRINVLLSRAQHGMYLIGNTETYQHIKMWADVHGKLAQSDSVGDSIALCCPRHPYTPIICSEPEDFARKSPEGGCELPCNDRLEPCGHRCQARCHSSAMHSAFLCGRECPRIRPTCDHACPKLCGEACGHCLVKVSNVVLPCGHIEKTMRCYETQDLSKLRCTAKVTKVPDCGHIVEVECCKNIESELFSCPDACTETLGCGHKCPGSCGQCRKGESHLRCTKVCGRPYGICNHRCSKRCHQEEDCGTCKKHCEVSLVIYAPSQRARTMLTSQVQCPHSRCAATCDQPCAPCIEKCAWSCKHRGACTMPCAAPCNRLPCEERCDKMLDCGHRCPSFCGEACPEQKFCQACGDQGEARVDFTEFKEYADIDLGDLPVVVLTCGHFYTGETLDLLVGMSQVYTLDSKGEYKGLEDISAALAKEVPLCPDCRLPIRQFSTRRYNRVINKAVMDETTKRFLASGQRSLDDLEKRLIDMQDGLKTAGFGKSRYEVARVLIREAGLLRGKMDTEHQPAKQLHDAIITRRRADDLPSLTASMQDLEVSPGSHSPGSVSALDKQVTLKARLLQLKVHETIFRDTSGLGKEHGKPAPGQKAMVQFLQGCADLCDRATDASLPRVSIAATLLYASVFHLQAYNSDAKPLAPVWDLDTVRDRLTHAGSLCDGLSESEGLHVAIDATVRLLAGPRYDEVTPEELKAIKAAMVSGSGGISTHSGHWYNCANGHPVSGLPEPP